MFRLPIGAGLTLATHLIMFVLGAAISSLAFKSRTYLTEMDYGNLYLSLNPKQFDFEGESESQYFPAVYLGWTRLGCKLHSDPVSIKLGDNQLLVSGGGRSLSNLARASQIQRRDKNYRLAIHSKVEEQVEEANEAQRLPSKICRGFERKVRHAPTK